MKKILLILAIIVPVTGWGQDNGHFLSSNMSFQANNNFYKVAVESTQNDNNSYGYAYSEAGISHAENIGNYLYLQMIWEQKFWETPIFLHGEYRGNLSNGECVNNFFFGGAYSMYFNHGCLIAEPLFRYDKFGGCGYQLSVVGSWDWKWCDLNHYTDWWGSKSTDGKPNNIYNEVRFYVKATKRIELGVVGILAYYPSIGLDKSLCGAIRVNL